MYKAFVLLLLTSILLLSCGTNPEKSNNPLMDVKTYFSKRLLAADSTMVIDSFRFIKWDTLHEKWTLIRQRYPYINDFKTVSATLDNILDSYKGGKGLLDKRKRDSIDFLYEEKEFLSFEIDSLNKLLVHADTIIPIGYMALYKCTVHKPNGFTITDTIHYSFNTKLQMVDWDRNNEKAIDSLVLGKRAYKNR